MISVLNWKKCTCIT